MRRRTVSNTKGNIKLKKVSRVDEFSSSVSESRRSAATYSTIANQPCHVTGVQPHPNNFLLNQYPCGLSFKYSMYRFSIGKFYHVDPFLLSIRSVKQINGA